MNHRGLDRLIPLIKIGESPAKRVSAATTQARGPRPASFPRRLSRASAAPPGPRPPRPCTQASAVSRHGANHAVELCVFLCDSLHISSLIDDKLYERRQWLLKLIAVILVRALSELNPLTPSGQGFQSQTHDSCVNPEYRRVQRKQAERTFR